MEGWRDWDMWVQADGHVSHWPRPCEPQLPISPRMPTQIYCYPVRHGTALHGCRYKESPEALREELYLASHYINHAARQALAALMEVGNRGGKKPKS